MKNPFKTLSKFETVLWLVSVTVVLISSFFSGIEGIFSGIASLVGVTALIFVAKGMITGQVLTIIFALMYGTISLFFKYYGEAITYVGMSMPMAAASLVSWIRHPFKDTDEVEISHMSPKKFTLVGITAVAVTAVFYFILRWLHTANLFFSTLSITTSWAACALTFLRSPYYALAYAANDIVLIVLWVAAAVTDISCLPMIFCFIMFLANDLYGFFNWKRMQKAQNDH
ncbi:MAG: nicotinamide mononucleotide transporter [Clostridia bacterium]|nr:nicotinamide mononucleotide transporter [Clostridia bacterium]